MRNINTLIFFILLIFAISCTDKPVQNISLNESDKNIAKVDCDVQYQSSDFREYQHGIDFIQKNDSTYYLVWGSSGIYPTGADSNGSWTHDIYYSKVNINNPQIIPVLLISANEAQEPPSTAVSDNGNIFITMEDGNDTDNGIAQRYAVYNKEMLTVLGYPNMVFDGGHSGHVAAVGNQFVVFWSDDWDDSVPGADGIGTGKDVLADVFSSTGNFIKRVDIAIGNERDWWPIIAGSANNACLVWQRYVEGDKYCNLHYSIYNPTSGELIKNNIELEQSVKYYTYDVQYYPQIDKFVIIGSYYNGGGFAYLLNSNGDIVDKITNIPEIVREAQGVSKASDLLVKVVYAVKPQGAMQLNLTENSISYEKSINDNYIWYGIGTDGIFINDSTVYMISLSPCGIINRTLNLN